MGKPIKSSIIFDSEKAKDVFLSVLDEYSSGVVELMSALSVSKGYGSADAKLEVLGDEIRINLIDRDKGVVLTKEGFLQHKSIASGLKYVVVKDGKPAMFIKSTGEGADTFLGYGSDMPTIVAELSKEHDIAKVIEGQQ